MTDFQLVFLDTNIFLRFLKGASTPADNERVATAERLFGQIVNQQIRATTSEVVLHEVAYVLTSPQQYGLAIPEAVHLVSAILRLPGLHFPGDDRSVYLRALDLWEQHPRLGFADAVIAARCEKHGHQLATFDRHFDDITSLQRWTPAPPAAS